MDKCGDGNLERWEAIEDDALVWRRGVESSDKDGSSKDREVRMFRKKYLGGGRIGCSLWY